MLASVLLNTQRGCLNASAPSHVHAVMCSCHGTAHCVMGGANPCMHVCQPSPHRYTSSIHLIRTPDPSFEQSVTHLVSPATQQRRTAACLRTAHQKLSTRQRGISLSRRHTEPDTVHRTYTEQKEAHAAAASAMQASQHAVHMRKLVGQACMHAIKAEHAS